MFNLYDVVRLKENDEKNGVKTTHHGTIVDVLGNGKAFTVEFFDDNGETNEKALMVEYTPTQLVPYQE